MFDVFFLLSWIDCLIISSPGPKVTIAITWRPSSVNFSHFSFFSETTGPIGTKLSRNVPWMVLYKVSVFFPVGYSTWLPGPIIFSDWLKFQRSSSLKLMNWLNPNCKWTIIGMFFTKFLFFMWIGNPRWPPPQDID